MIRSMTVLAIAVGICAAAETVDLNDLRLGVGIAPMPTNMDGTTVHAPASNPGAVGTADHERFESTPGLGVGVKATFGHLAPVGLVYGGELRFVNGRRNLVSDMYGGVPFEVNQALSYEYTSIGLAGNLGIGMSFSSGWHGELVAIAGLDHVTAEVPANPSAGSVNRIPGKGNGHTYGIRSGVYWTDAESNWQYGLEAEWTRSVCTIEASYIDVTIRYTDVVASGLGLKGSIGYRF